MGLASWGLAEFNMAGGVLELVPSGNVRSTHTQTVAGDGTPAGADEVPKHVRTDEYGWGGGSRAFHRLLKLPS